MIRSLLQVEEVGLNTKTWQWSKSTRPIRPVSKSTTQTIHLRISTILKATSKSLCLKTTWDMLHSQEDKHRICWVVRSICRRLGKVKAILMATLKLKGNLDKEVFPQQDHRNHRTQYDLAVRRKWRERETYSLIRIFRLVFNQDMIISYSTRARRKLCLSIWRMWCKYKRIHSLSPFIQMMSHRIFKEMTSRMT